MDRENVDGICDILGTLLVLSQFSSHSLTQKPCRSTFLVDEHWMQECSNRKLDLVLEIHDQDANKNLIFLHSTNIKNAIVPTANNTIANSISLTQYLCKGSTLHLLILDSKVSLQVTLRKTLFCELLLRTLFCIDYNINFKLFNLM